MPAFQYFFRYIKKLVFALLFCLPVIFCSAQNNKIRCFFNHPVNNYISTGFNAVYANGSFADTIAAYISRAKYSIDVAVYNFSSTAFSNVYKIALAANAAAARGVVIRWIYDGSNSNTGLSLLGSGIITYASPVASGYIMHNKFVVIDASSNDYNDPVIITGSYNFSDQQTNEDYNNILIIQDKNIALAYYNEFNKMWGGTASKPNPGNATFGSKKTTSSQRIFIVDGNTIEVYFSPKDSVGLHLQDAVNTAGYDLFFGIYTFTDNAIAKLIKDKYNSGVQVRGIVDNFSTPFAAYATLNPVLAGNLITYKGPGVYHNKIMLIDALNPASDPQVFTGSFNWSLAAENSNDENAVIIHNAAIANQYYQSLCNNFTFLGGIPCVSPPCPNANTVFVSGKRGNTYQWQLNTGTGFSNITSGSNYSGVTTENLLLYNTPSSWYGYQYRCLVNGSTYSDTNTLKFTAYWNGNASTAWENTANWNCGILPDANTDVIINSGVKYFPVLNASTRFRSLSVNKNARLSIIKNTSLSLKGN
jgi:hypothetical protein